MSLSTAPFDFPGPYMIWILSAAEGEGHRLRVRDLLRRVGLPPIGMLRQLAALVRAGVVERIRDPEHRLGGWLRMTMAGEQAWRDWVAENARRDDPLGMLRLPSSPAPQATEQRFPAGPHAPECKAARWVRLNAELADDPWPGRAAAIRMELDALRPRLAAKADTLDQLAAGWGGPDMAVGADAIRALLA